MSSEVMTGYRLDYLEFYNWGTFDGRTARIVPGCQSSLMTGANGSGKTTIVDALLTLLVPSQKRFYNQSSGAEQKKDRSEESYILGEIGKTRDDEALESRKKYLRPDKTGTASFLLGCFFNSETGNYVTLVQARWFSTTELKRTYIVSPHKLSIEKEIMPFDKHGEWRKRLKKLFSKTEISDSFGQYSQEFIRLFNMRSEKALTLFNQTVGIKVLGNLNEFIRVHMLEDGEQEDEFQKLRANYLDLLETYRNLQKAEEQVRLLEPIIEKLTEHESVKKLQEELDNIKSALPFYFSEQELTILNKLVADTKGLLREQEELIKQKEREKDRKDDELKALQSAIDNSAASEAIKEIEAQIKTLNSDLNRKKNKAEEYNAIAESLNYKKLSSKEIFYANRKLGEEDLKVIQSKSDTTREAQIEQGVLLKQNNIDSTTLQEEIQSLKGRKNRIPLDSINLREKMLQELQLRADEIPFIGELIRIREDEKAWEPAIERLIRSFGLRLLVPEQHLRAVNLYVHKTNLKGKIVYERVLPNIKTKPGHLQGSETTLRDKIELKDKIPFFEPWLENAFLEHQNHVCAETQNEFDRARKALMISGLSKNGDRHEKDDRLDRVTQSKFILGWDNKEQIQYIEGKLKNLEIDAEAITKRIRKLQEDETVLNRKKEQVQALLHYQNYGDLNWQDDQASIETLSTRKARLSKESGLDELMQQREDALNIVQKLADVIKEEVGKSGQLKERISTFEESIKNTSSFLTSEHLDSAKTYYHFIPAYLQTREFSDPLRKIQTERARTMEFVDAELRLKANEEAKVREKIIRLMSAFISPSDEVRRQYPDWSKDTVDLSASLNYTDSFRQLYDRVTEEDLPKHKNEFKEYMKESVTSRITSFKTGLDNRQEEIEEHILHLNKSLNKIDFNVNPHTFIQLRSKPTKDQEVRKFKEALSACIVPVADIELSKTDDWVNTAFLNIRDLIESLHTDKDKRKRLIDVRNWMDFEAEEFYRIDNKRRMTLDSSDSLSGGEKAQFTYTVLGAAIAFQFGINENAGLSNSFRFIAVDEAFSKLDPEKSHYLMALCRQLNLQILVVTPLDKIYVAEEYISSCHYVEKQSTDRSRVYNLTMQQYNEQKRNWEG